MIIDGQSTEDPQKIAEAFVKFFKNKGDDLAAAIKSDPNFDPLEQLRKKYENSDLKFNFKPVEKDTVRKI